jgi:hypothetical protein
MVQPPTILISHRSLRAFATKNKEVIEVRIGTSFISVEQARQNLEHEIPLGFRSDSKRTSRSMEAKARHAWRWTAQATTSEDRLHRLVPRHCYIPESFQSMATTTAPSTTRSILANPIQRIFDLGHIPRRVQFADACRSGTNRRHDSALLQNYKEGGWMPKWPNPSYTNIMIGTHADSLVAEAMRKHFKGFDYGLAWDAVYKDAMTPPDGDTTRAGPTANPTLPTKGEVALPTPNS